MHSTRQLPITLRILSGTQFGVFCLGNGLSLVGTWMQRIACGWLVWEWTQSSFWLGVLAAGDLLPVMLIGPFAGVAADRWDRLRQNVRAQAVSALLAVLMAVLLAIGHLGLVEVILLTTLQGTISAAIQPARLAMIRQMVGREDLGAAVALNSVTVNLARLIGPALAGMMMVGLDIIWVFVANAFLTTIYVVILGRLSLASPQKSAESQPFLRQMADGFAYVIATPALWLILTVMLLGGTIVRSMIELMPAIAVRDLSQQPGGDKIGVQMRQWTALIMRTRRLGLRPWRELARVKGQACSGAPAQRTSVLRCQADPRRSFEHIRGATEVALALRLRDGSGYHRGKRRRRTNCLCGYLLTARLQA